MKNNDEKGITLIALVVTVVVLLILAGVSIATLTGENGILTQANKAKEVTEKASIDEQRKLAQVEALKNSKNTEYKGVTIPAGFAPTRIEGEDNVENGLVITDSEGNEFVWIPVENETSYEININYEQTNMSEYAIEDEDYLPTEITIPEGKTEVQVEEKLVRNAGGFYIARYEAGKETIKGTDTLVSKKGATVWVKISQIEAKAKAKTFINNSSVKSALMTGIQWDMTMKFISSQPRIDGTGKNYDVTVASNTRHKGESIGVEISGNNEADKVCNIYDLEGNACERIAEKNTSSPYQPYGVRGGRYDYKRSASYRTRFTNIAYIGYSFRFVLYVI